LDRMLKKIRFFKLICLIMVFVLAIQAFVYAGDVVDTVASAVTIVVGVALVVTGVGAAVMAGGLLAPAWGTAVAGTTAGVLAGTGTALIVGGDQWSRRDEIRKNYGGGSGAGGGSETNNPAPPDPKNWQIEVKINDTGDKTKKTAVIQIKDIYSGAYIAPPSGYAAYVSHSNSQVHMTIGGALSFGLKAESIDTSSFVSIKDAPNLTVSGIPNIIKYALSKQSQLARLEVLNSAGAVVYAFSESMPNPARPIPFVWKGKDLGGNNVAPGAYSVRIKAIKGDGSTEYSPISVMSVASSIPADNEQLLTFDSENKAYVTFFNPSSSSATDSIRVVIKDSSGDRLIKNSSVVFEGGGTAPIILQNSLNFALNMTSNIDGVPVKVTIPGADDSSKNIKMIINEGGAEQATYEYDPINGTVSLNGSAHTSSKADVYYGILKMMENIENQVFGQGGISYDKDNNDLKINMSKFANKSGIASDYKVDISKDANTISTTVSKGSNSVTSTYDLNDNKVTMPADFTWAGDFNWDLTSSNLALIEGPSVAGVKVMSGDLSFIGESRKILAALNKTLFAAILAKEYLKVTTPMIRPVEPDITDIIWYPSLAKTVTVKGTAGGVLPHIYVTNGSTVREVTGVSYSGGIWSVNISLNNGENMINAVVSTADGREVESGDATVYIGTNGGPDLILVSPRDRQVFESSVFPFEENGNSAKGLVSPGYSLSIGGEDISVDSSGNFNDPINIKNLQEGQNNISISVSGGHNLSFVRSFIGAYKFINDVKSNAYVLRRGDFMFSNKGLAGFDVIPLEPDHVGVYLGNKKVIDPIMTGIEEHDLSVKDNNNYYYGEGFYYATQIPKLADENKRSAVVEKIKPYIGTEYDLPINLLTFKGHYDGADNGKFYCSELGYWAWNQVAGSNTGINLLNIMYPFRGINDSSNSILPAYFCEETMKVKEVAK